MGGYVKIEIEVTPEAASLLRDTERRRRAGELLSRIVINGGAEEDDPLLRLFDEIAADWKAAGLTDKDLEEELAAYNAERRDRR